MGPGGLHGGGGHQDCILKDKQFALWKDTNGVLSRRDCLTLGLAFADLASSPERPVPLLGSHSELRAAALPTSACLPTGVGSSEEAASGLSLGPGASSLLTPALPRRPPRGPPAPGP